MTNNNVQTTKTAHKYNFFSITAIVDEIYRFCCLKDIHRHRCVNHHFNKELSKFCDFYFNFGEEVTTKIELPSDCYCRTFWIDFGCNHRVSQTQFQAEFGHISDVCQFYFHLIRRYARCSQYFGYQQHKHEQQPQRSMYHSLCKDTCVSRYSYNVYHCTFNLERKLNKKQKDLYDKIYKHKMALLCFLRLEKQFREKLSNINNYVCDDLFDNDGCFKTKWYRFAQDILTQAMRNDFQLRHNDNVSLLQTVYQVVNFLWSRMEERMRGGVLIPITDEELDYYVMGFMHHIKPITKLFLENFSDTKCDTFRQSIASKAVGSHTAGKIIKNTASFYQDVQRKLGRLRDEMSPIVYLLFNGNIDGWIARLNNWIKLKSIPNACFHGIFAILLFIYNDKVFDYNDDIDLNLLLLKSCMHSKSNSLIAMCLMMDPSLFRDICHFIEDRNMENQRNTSLYNQVQIVGQDVDNKNRLQLLAKLCFSSLFGILFHLDCISNPTNSIYDRFIRDTDMMNDDFDVWERCWNQWYVYHYESDSDSDIGTGILTKLDGRLYDKFKQITKLLRLLSKFYYQLAASGGDEYKLLTFRSVDDFPRIVNDHESHQRVSVCYPLLIDCLPSYVNTQESDIFISLCSKYNQDIDVELFSNVVAVAHGYFE